MKSTEELMAQLDSMDIKLQLEGEHLRCSAPNQVMTPTLKSELAARKAEIIHYLRTANDRSGTVMPPITPVCRDGEIELSDGQQRLWALAQLRQNSSIYNISSSFRMKGPLDLAALEIGLREIQRRHEILRTTFPSSGVLPHQKISTPSDVVLHFTDLRGLPEEKRETGAMDLMLTEVQKPFDVVTGPLWRIQLLQFAEEDHILAFTMHHLIFDGWSKNVLHDDITVFYNAAVSGKQPEIAPMPVQYADFARWHHSWLAGETVAKEFEYWKEQLNSISELMIPASRARPAIQTFQGDNRSFSVPPELLAALNDFGRREGVSLFISMLTAFDLLLYCYTEQEDLAICTPVACRNRSELERMIGYFNNIVVMRTDLSGNPTIHELVGRVRRTVLGASNNQDVPIQKLAELPSLARIPLTRAMFSYRNTPDRTLAFSGVSATPVRVRKRTSDFDIALYAELREGSLGGALEFNTDVIDPDTVTRLLQDFLTTLGYMVTNPDCHISEAPHFGPRPSEVEALLARHPQVTEAVVVAHRNRPGLRKLAAYVVPDQYNIPQPEDLRSYLARQLPDYLVPYIFVPLSRMPLAADGKVDPGALPVPDSLRRTSGSVYVMPRTPVERQLAQIWTRVLWLDQEVGIRDNFFDMGGHSLLSVQLVTEMESLLKRKLPTTVLARLSTIENLVGLLDNDAAPGAESSSGMTQTIRTRDGDTADVPASWTLAPEIYHGLLAHTSAWHGKRVRPTSLVMGLNTESTRQRLFWCCQGYHELTQLAKHLGPDQPVYGMRSTHKLIDPRKKDQQTVDAFAAQYVNEILEVQHEEPFLVGGNCQSALIAFQIAKQLLARGHYITLLCLQERFIPQFYPGRVALFYGDDSKRNPFHYFNQPEKSWRKFYTGKCSSNEIAGRHGEFFREPNIQVLTAKLRAEIAHAQNEPRIEIPLQEKDQGPRLPDSGYNARLQTTGPVNAEPGESLVIPVEVTNNSTSVWPAGGARSITAGYRWTRRVAVGHLWRRYKHIVLSVDPGVALPADLPAGASTKLELRLSAPLQSGVYELEIDMVEGGDVWFKEKRSKTEVVKIRVFRVFKLLRCLGLTTKTN